MDRNGYIGRAPADSSVVVARQVYSPSGVTTDFTFNSGYVPGYLDLYLNGTRMVEGSDYTATDTSTITLISAATNGDVLEAVAYKAYNATTSNRIGIQSAGSLIGNVDALNFIGAGNTFLISGTTVDVSISGGAGAGGTWANYDGMAGITTSKKVRIDNNLDVTGNISVGGTLTYEDVTNVDAIGISTIRKNLFVVPNATPGEASEIGIGIGTGTANYRITAVEPNTQINFGTAGDVGGFLMSSNDGQFGISGGTRWNGSNWNARHTGSAQVRTDGDGVLLFFADASLTKGNNFTPTERLRILSDGTISGGVLGATPGTVAAGSFIQKNSNAGFFVDGGDGKFGTSSNNSVLLQVNGAEKFRIHTGGQIGLGGANYGTSGQVLTSQGSGSAAVWADAGGGMSTEAFAVGVGTVITLDLTNAQDHKVTATGITTITCTGGAEGVSHDIRIINSGIATVGFSTYFLFPSGAAPSIPSADGKISMISFTVNRVGTAGTQLLSGASVNYS
tara:strand:- start:3112 stop:4629 length:1518 start_codon:yes stop_codon:yes gene_type:complete